MSRPAAGDGPRWRSRFIVPALESNTPVHPPHFKSANALDHAEWQRWIDWMQEHQISWLTWSVADKNETCSMLLPRASSYGGWSEADLKESGRLTRAYLRKFAGKTEK